MSRIDFEIDSVCVNVIQVFKEDGLTLEAIMKATPEYNVWQ